MTTTHERTPSEPKPRKEREPNRSAEEITLERLCDTPPDALHKLGLAMAARAPLAARTLAAALTEASTTARGPV